MATVTKAKTKSYTFIVEYGSNLRTANVGLYEAYSRIAANDNLSDEACCLLAWHRSSEVKPPLAWDVKRQRLIFKQEDMQDEFIPIKVKYVD